MENKYKQNTLRHWYLGEYEWNDEKVLLAYGQFYNRPRIANGRNGRWHSGSFLIEQDSMRE